MKLFPIFTKQTAPNKGEGLWAVAYEPNTQHAFREFFGRMEDPDWVFNFCQENAVDIASKFGYGIPIEDAAFELMQESQTLKGLIVSLARGDHPERSLQQVFRPLLNSESNLRELQLSKGSVKNQDNGYNPKLRIYSVRFSRLTYAVTGGAIKLTDRMEERPHTDQELKKLRKVKTWLQEEGICFPEDLKATYDDNAKKTSKN